MSLVEVCLALGGNLGDRAAHLRAALAALSPYVRISTVSALYETDPWGYADQPAFLNAACRGRTELAPEALLALAKQIEEALGREPSFRNAPRPIDIDILFYGDQVVDQPHLRIPHPRLPERAFVLVPLADVAPEWRHPVLGRTVAELLAAVDTAGVRPGKELL